MIPNIVFFARDYQAELFPKLSSARYKSLFVTLTVAEKRIINKSGYEVVACFEEDFYRLPVSEVPDSYLKTSFVSDRFFGRFSLEERRLILSKEIAFWQNIYEKYKPAAVVNELIAIEIAEVMYIEASKRNIRYFAWVSSPFSKRSFYWASEPDHSRLDEKVFLESPGHESVTFAEQYYSKLNGTEDVRPFYVSNLPSRYNPRVLAGNLSRLVLKSFRSGFNSTGNKYLVSYYFDKTDLRIRINNSLNSFFRSYDKLKNDYSLVFYPLHYEPEASILYMSEYLEDQLSLIRNLSKCLKNNQLLVVKEHPQQPGMLLSDRFRQIRMQLSNIAFIPAEYPAREIIRKSEIVITQTSSAGWEGMILGKPVFVLGKVFYDRYKKINVVNSFDELKKSIHNRQYRIPKREDTIEFIARFWNYCREGNPFPHHGLYDKENIFLIVKAIEEKLTEA